ncbi:MAG: FKBP-type peptidyl-prolyl cis-trans isomerase [Ktedonobacteraceae bacterium]|nr:FKBP-type peptidyl-prolyl cis-trans isomerase [Ktedonobacteraceae bacterium]
MTQTARDQKNSSQRVTRPGQRQQERLLRLARRRRRQRNVLAVIALLFLLTAAGVGFWQYQKYNADQQALKDKHSTATAVASITPTPSDGPATPPPVTGQPVSLADGLQYIDVKVGNGGTVQANSTVSVQYTGWLQKENKKFDSSYGGQNAGKPVSFSLGQGQVIPGWDKGLVGMKEGGTRRLIIPPALAYGKNGNPPTIPANSTLIFDVTIVSIDSAS